MTGLHELDPAFRKVTLENEDIKAVARDLKFHRDPAGTIFVLLWVADHTNSLPKLFSP